MGNPTEKTKTTDYVIKTIRANLNAQGYTSAILLSFIYVNIRLRTLLTDYLSPAREKWKETHAILSSLQFPRLLKYCKTYKLIDEGEREKLAKLADKRNYLAHESVLWRKLTQEDVNNIEQHCQFAITFLKDTTSRTSYNSSEAKVTTIDAQTFPWVTLSSEFRRNPQET